MNKTISFKTVIVACVAFACSAYALADGPRKLDIPAGDLAAALASLAKQSGVELMYSTEQIKGLKTDGIRGKYTAEVAAAKLLEGTKLKLKVHESGGLLISAGDAPASTSWRGVGKGGIQLARVEDAETENVESLEKDDDSRSEYEKGIPELLVKGRRSLNADIRRTESDPQPYVIFEREEIRRSQAVNVEDFLRTRLPMNAAAGSEGQKAGNATTTSSIDLRGLGPHQTLVLIDGRRMPGIANLGSPLQPDLNGIPMAMIERIEVLPSTAGGIYGGGATGGVINVILRRDFQGYEAGGTYANTFDTDAASVRLDASAGFSLEDGRTQVLIAATRSDANILTLGDRDFAQRAIALQLQNNPSRVTGLTSPPLGGTVNIRSVSGDLVLKSQYGGTALGSAITHIPTGYRGPASDNGAALVANAGTYNLDLPEGLQGKGAGLIASPSMESAFLNLRREMSGALELFVDLSTLGNKGRSLTGGVPSAISDLPASAPNNPFQQNINVSFPLPGFSAESHSKSRMVRATGGLIAQLPHQWVGELDYGWSRSRFQYIHSSSVVDSVASCVLARGIAAGVDPDGAGPLQPCAAGDLRPALNALQEGNTNPIDFTPYLLPLPNYFSGPYDTTLKDATLRLSGPVLKLSGGPLSVSILLEHREEMLEDAIFQLISTTTRQWRYIFSPHKSQASDSYYVEARAPLIDSSNGLPWVRELELQASARHDEYKTQSDPRSALFVSSREGPFPELNNAVSRLESTNYTLGLRLVPSTDLTVRASMGTGFLPPSVIQIAPSSSVNNFSYGFLDPKRGNTDMYVGQPWTLISGGNPNLKPEHSESWSAGLIVTPRFAPNFRLSIDYTQIEKADEIQAPGFQFLLDNENAFPGRIMRGANLAGDLAGWAGPITSWDVSLFNIAQTAVEAYDVQLDVKCPTQHFGEFRGHAVATWEPHYKYQLLPSAPVLDSVGFTGGPLEWRGNLGVAWEKGPLKLSWNAQYYDSYLLYSVQPNQALTDLQVGIFMLNQGSTKIASQTYHDLTASYRFDAVERFAGGLFANSEISFGIQNVLDKSPPIIASTNPSAPGYSAYGDPRLRRYTVNLRKSFGHR